MAVFPHPLFNVILNIGGKKIYSRKEYLAAHSPVFEAMFFGEFAEKGKEEVEIKEVVYEEFLDLLQILHECGKKIDHKNIDHVLQLADRFDLKIVREKCVSYLETTNDFSFRRRFELAFTYRLTTLEESLIGEMGEYEARAILRSSFFPSLSLQTVTALFSRTVDVAVARVKAGCPYCPPSPSYSPFPYSP